jgi:CBS domain-containing protein
MSDVSVSDVSQLDPEEFDDPLSNYEPADYPSEIHRALAEESVDAMQTRPMVQISLTAPIREAVQAMHCYGVSSLLVVEDGKVVGIFTERDVLERVAEHFERVASNPVQTVMTADPTVVYESDPAAAAVAGIAVAGHRHIPVLRVDGTVSGIVSPLRVINFLGQQRFSSSSP